MMTLGKMINHNQFAYIVSDKKLRKVDLHRGELVFVGAVKPLPISKSDPYVQQVYAIVFKTVDGIPLIPKDNNEFKAYLVNPKNLEPVEEKLQKELTEQLHKNYGVVNDTTD